MEMKHEWNENRIQNSKNTVGNGNNKQHSHPDNVSTHHLSSLKKGWDCGWDRMESDGVGLRLVFPNRFRINLCAPFSEIWARRVHDICLDSRAGMRLVFNSIALSLSHSLCLHKIKHPPRSANKFHCEPTIQTIIPCTNSFAALLSHAINTAHTAPPSHRNGWMLMRFLINAPR